MGAGVGAIREREKAPISLQGPPDRALRVSTLSTAIRQTASSNPARGANFLFSSDLDFQKSDSLVPKDSVLCQRFVHRVPCEAL